MSASKGFQGSVPKDAEIIVASVKPHLASLPGIRFIDHPLTRRARPCPSELQSSHHFSLSWTAGGDGVGRAATLETFALIWFLDKGLKQCKFLVRHPPLPISLDNMFYVKSSN